jgi:hypothetical protein
VQIDLQRGQFIASLLSVDTIHEANETFVKVARNSNFICTRGATTTGQQIADGATAFTRDLNLAPTRKKQKPFKSLKNSVTIGTKVADKFPNAKCG